MKPAGSFLHLDRVQWNVCYWWPPCQIMTFIFPSYCTSLLIPPGDSIFSKGEWETMSEKGSDEQRNRDSREREREESPNLLAPIGRNHETSDRRLMVLISLSPLHQRMTWLKPCHYCISGSPLSSQLVLSLSLSPFSPSLYCFRLDPLSSLCWLLTFLIITMI